MLSLAKISYPAQNLFRLLTSPFGTHNNISSIDQWSVWANKRIEGRDLENLKTELANISKFDWEAQKAKRELLLETLLRDFYEHRVLDAFSEIYLDNTQGKTVRDQAVLCINRILSEKTNEDLHGYISDEGNHQFARKWGVYELIDRDDHTANLAFLYKVVTTNDHIDIRRACAYGLGELGNGACLAALRKIKQSDPIYPEVQEAIGNINERINVLN